MLENALAASKAWPDLKTSVNVSPAQLRNPSFPDQVRDLLAKTGVKPSRLTLEITEGFLVRQPERAKKALLALRAVGVSIALDDFGAGYASIGYLRQFHFDRLKIDKSLVSALDRDPSAAAFILQATVALANAFRIPVTQEGVEREEQAAMLRLAGCDELGRPMASREPPLISEANSSRCRWRANLSVSKLLMEHQAFKENAAKQRVGDNSTIRRFDELL